MVDFIVSLSLTSQAVAVLGVPQSVDSHHRHFSDSNFEGTQVRC